MLSIAAAVMRAEAGCGRAALTPHRNERRPSKNVVLPNQIFIYAREEHYF